MPASLKKRCYRCGKVKELTEFYHNRDKRDYHNGICKECQLEVNAINKK